MRYISTRGGSGSRDFSEILLAGMAVDGGLYVPVSWPSFSKAEWRAMRGLPYAELVALVMHPLIGESISLEILQHLCKEAYAGFGSPAIVPLVQVDTGVFVQELFHGPTLAFKDLAMQLLGRLFEHVLQAQDRRVTIVGATSGDTGSAAIEAFRCSERVNVAILHPKGRTSEVQRRQMTSVLAPNILNLAVGGTFDDCQDLVKALFADVPFREEMRLSAVNSINWARIAAQIPYYAAAALALGAPDREVAFSVPTGNFGNVLAAYAASRMGLPIARLVVASNRNDILFRFLALNDMSIGEVVPSLSPSMDIQVSSNFERLLFELLDRSAVATAAMMMGFRTSGRMVVPDSAWRRAREMFAGFRLDDGGTTAEIARLHRVSGYLADPHTAVGVAAARAEPVGEGVPMIAAATAHPAKFPDAIEAAIGVRPRLPPQLADLCDRPEEMVDCPAELAAVEAAIRAMVLRNVA